MKIPPPFIFPTVLPAEEDQSFMKAGVLVHRVGTPTNVTQVVFLNHRNGIRLAGQTDMLVRDAEEQAEAMKTAWEALGKLTDETIDWVVAKVKADFKG